MIPLFKVRHPKGLGNLIDKVYESGIITEGDYADEFEKKIGEYIGNPNVCLVNSCTSALSLAAHMCSIGPGQEIITTSLTCLATNLPFYQLGAKLVFADVDPTTGNIDPKSVAKLITNKTKAIVVVHWAGQPVELNEIHKIAIQYNIPVIEDAAHALRAEYDNIRIGSHSDYVCFSFQAIKQLSTVDGGAIACKRPEDAALIRKIRWFGLDRSFKSPPGQPPASRWEQDITHGGFKMHMNNINAAIGLLQMETIDEVIDAHIANGKYYDGYIHNPKIEKMRRPTNTKSAFWIYSLLVDDPVKFKQYMTENGIATDVVHVRNDKYTIFENFRPSEPLKGLDHFASKLMHIPVGWWLSEDERNYIVDTVNKY
jgi:dTDP-4-amino-4,6-dideoxygalactose transaminase